MIRMHPARLPEPPPLLHPAAGLRAGWTIEVPVVRARIRPDGSTGVKLRGQGGGRTIEMWVNLTTNPLETAYPI